VAKETGAHNSRVLDQFSQQAEGYARLVDAVGRRGQKPDPLLDLVRPETTDRALDVGCGTGQRVIALASRVAQVTGFDLTPAMLDQARALQAQAGITNVHWVQGDATNLPFADGDFSLVVSQAMFHHAADPAATLAQMRRVCSSGGRIAISDLTPAAEKSAAFDAIELLRDPSHAHALTLTEFREMGAQLGLEEVAVRSHLTEVPIEPVLAASRPPAGMLDHLLRLYAHDAASGADSLGMGAHLKDGVVWASYPLSVIIWRK
jgi:ubiquinone/menaquinone biosynthesis C-methylase UbiE